MSESAPAPPPPRIRISTFLLVVFMLFFAGFSFLQWRYIDTLERELEVEQNRTSMLQKELARIAN